MNDTPFYAAKKIINRMNKAVEGFDTDEATLIRMVEPLAFTEFGGRTDRETFVDIVCELYAIIPKVLESYDPTKGTKLESWGWRLMKHAGIRFIQKQDKLHANEQPMEDWTEDEAIGDDGHGIAWQSDTGWYGEPEGSGSRAMRFQAEFDMVKKILEPREARLLEWMLEGQTQTYMADKLGLSQSRVNRLISAMEGKIRQFSSGEVA